MATNKTLSIILLSYHSGRKLKIARDRLAEILTPENIPYELIIIDDGSTDDSYQLALQLESEYSEVKAFQLARNCTSNYAAFAGFSICNGACAVLIPDDEQQPYQTLVDMYRIWEEGEKVIIPYRESRAGPAMEKLFSGTFYRIMNAISEIRYPPGGADIVFVDREVIDLLTQRISHINTAIVPETLRLGFSPYFFPYARPRGTQEKSRWSFKKKFKLAKDVLFSSSNFLINLISYMGLFFAGISALIILFYTYIRLFGNTDFWGQYVPGWTSIIFFLSFFSGLILLSLGVIAQYIWLIYDEVKNRPAFVIRKKTDD